MTKQPAKKAPAPKRDHTQIHAWLNSVGVLGALIVAIYAAFLSHQALLRKKEKLGFNVTPEGGCQLEYLGGATQGELGLRWDVTITNESEDKLSIVTHQGFSIGQSGAPVFMSGFREIEDLEGHELNFPLTLDGGEARAVVVRVAFPISDAKQAVLIQGFLHGRSRPTSVAALQQYLAEHNLDVAGNNLNVRRDKGKILGWSVNGPPKFDQAIVEITTGRKAHMTAAMSYPPRPSDGSIDD